MSQILVQILSRFLLSHCVPSLCIDGYSKPATHTRRTRILWLLSGNRYFMFFPPWRASHVSRSHEIHAFYLDLHSKSRDYKKRIRAKNAMEIQEGKTPTQGCEVEMNNFQNPQVWVFYFYFEPSSLIRISFCRLALKWPASGKLDTTSQMPRRRRWFWCPFRTFRTWHERSTHRVPSSIWNLSAIFSAIHAYFTFDHHILGFVNLSGFCPIS